MSLAVATMNTRARCSASQVRNAPSTRRESRCRHRPWTAPSRSHRATTRRGERLGGVTATRAGSSRIRRAISNTTRRSPAAPAARRARRRRRAPPGSCRSPARLTTARPWAHRAPGALPSNAALRCRIQRRRFFRPPTSAKRAVSDFEGQRAAAIQQLVLRRHQRPQVVFGERAVVEYGLAREPLDIVQRQARRDCRPASPPPSRRRAACRPCLAPIRAPSASRWPAARSCPACAA